MPNILRTRCAIVGDSKVGKTAVVQSFVADGNAFPKNYQMTIGLDLQVKSVNIPESEDKVELLMYDCSGKDIYLDALPKYWSSPALILVVVDVCNPSSLLSANRWVELVKRCSTDVPISGALLANKIDLTARRVIPTSAAMQVANQLGLQYFEGSAEKFEGVEEPFFYLANEWHKMFVQKSNTFGSLT